MAKDFYQTLGVARDASADSIKKAYRKMAKEYHPDKNKGDASAEAKFKEINEAYDTLKDPQKRAAYDRYGHDAYQQGGSGGGGFSSGFSDFNFSGGSFSDIFEEIFSGGARSGSASRQEVSGNDLRYDCTMTLEEAFRGKDLSFRMKSFVKCEVCAGSGSSSGKVKICGVCGGHGRTRVSQGFFVVERTCNACNGMGHIIEQPCKQCSGAGRYTKTRTLEVKIPAGVENGMKIRLAGDGEAGIRGGRAGDLYIYVTIKSHTLFKRDGSSISCEVPIPMATAILGGEVDVPTIDGNMASLKINPGTQGGQVYKMRSKGMSILRSSHRGDMFVHVKVETPINLSERQKALIHEFQKEEHVSPQSNGFFSRVKDFLRDA